MLNDHVVELRNQIFSLLCQEYEEDVSVCLDSISENGSDFGRLNTHPECSQHYMLHSPARLPEFRILGGTCKQLRRECNSFTMDRELPIQPRDLTGFDHWPWYRGPFILRLITKMDLHYHMHAKVWGWWGGTIEDCGDGFARGSCTTQPVVLRVHYEDHVLKPIGSANIVTWAHYDLGDMGDSLASLHAMDIDRISHHFDDSLPTSSGLTVRKFLDLVTYLQKTSVEFWPLNWGLLDLSLGTEGTDLTKKRNAFMLVEDLHARRLVSVDFSSKRPAQMHDNFDLNDTYQTVLWEKQY